VGRKGKKVQTVGAVLLQHRASGTPMSGSSCSHCVGAYEKQNSRQVLTHCFYERGRMGCIAFAHIPVVSA
jgi:hypothetical protein